MNSLKKLLLSSGSKRLAAIYMIISLMGCLNRLQAASKPQYELLKPHQESLLTFIEINPLLSLIGFILLIIFSALLLSILIKSKYQQKTELMLSQLHLAVEQSPSIIIITDINGNTEYVNPKFTEITGYSKKEILGKNPRLLKSGETPAQDYKKLWETISSGKTWQGEFHNKTKSGKLYWESASISPVFNSNGRIINYIAVKENITQRKEMETKLTEVIQHLEKTNFEMKSANERLEQEITDRQKAELALQELNEWNETLLVSIPFGINVIDDTCTLLYMNKLQEDTFGIDGINRKCWELYNPEGGSCPECPVIGMTAAHFTREINFKNGKTYLVHHSAFNYHGKKAYLQVFQDITERKKAEIVIMEMNLSLEKRVQSAIDELREKDNLLISQSRYAALGEMIGNIAHQWRQPLNAVGILIQNIWEYYNQGKLDSEYLQRNVEKGTLLIQHMSQTIDDFRNFFKPEQEKRQFPASESLYKTISLIEASLKSNNIELEIKQEDEALLTGFPNEFSQALLNLLGNAKDVLLEKNILHAKIRVHLYLENNRFVLTVADNGGGVPENIMNRIFEPYFTTKKSGTGIGLYMTRTIIEKHMGGTLSFQNTKEGALFKIDLPTTKNSTIG